MRVAALVALLLLAAAAPGARAAPRVEAGPDAASELTTSRGAMHCSTALENRHEAGPGPAAGASFRHSPPLHPRLKPALRL